MRLTWQEHETSGDWEAPKSRSEEATVDANGAMTDWMASGG